MDYLIYILPSTSPSPGLWTIGTSIASVVIAITAVIFSWLQSRKTDKHNRLMVTPHLSSLTTVNNEGSTLLVHLENNGIGPAIIRDFSVYVDNKLIDEGDEVENGLASLLKNIPVSKWGHESITRNSFLPAGGKIELATIISTTISPEEIVKLVDPRFRIEITYHSIYGEIFKYNSDD